jgi:competence protein ComEC
MRGAGGSLLLAGDISSPIESRLAVLADLQHAVLLVPHHGSKSSSDPVFIDRVQPELAVATASLGNRFGFPTEDVQKRFRQAGVPLISTGACGAVQILLAGGKIQSVRSARRERKRIWRWPAERNCP